MYGEHHEFNGVLVCYTNVTALIAAREAAEQSARAKSVFLARMSHEIRTPMNAIIGLSKLSLREELEPKVRSYCKDVNSAANNLLGIINDILDFSKIDSGKMEIAAAEYQFASLINDVIRIIRMRLEDVPVQFVTDIGEDIPGRLIGDEVRIRQILLNLLSNAVKYTSEGQISFVMRAVIGKDGNITLIATVTDTGIGIKEADQQKLFGDFTRIDSEKNRSVEGSGLGLVIAQSLCRAMGGDVSVKSEYGTGSTFTAIIPQRAEDFTPFTPASDLNADNKREDAFVRFVAPDARILIVDDISMNLRVAEGLVAPYKTQVDIASSGMQAINMVKSHEYDIVFMDHMMPEMDGIEAAGHIRKWEQEQREQGTERKAVSIIALTANAITGMREMFLAEGFNDYLSKPIEIPKLDEILAKWIPKEKRQKPQGKTRQDDLLKEADAVNALIIPGVDVKKGITMTGGTIAGYRAVLSVFQMDAENRLGFFAAPPAEGKLAVLTMQAHALKSAAATIGATELSRRAAALEAAGRAGNRAVIETELAPFLEQLRETVKNIREACSNAQAFEAESLAADGEDGGQTPPNQAGPSLFVSKLTELKAALELKNMKEIDRVLAKMESIFLESEWAETVSRISTHILMSEFKEALLLIDQAL
jgi:CheY-like chemotaxis protein/nitrogen-specific signal transduction histidine kinase